MIREKEILIALQKKWLKNLFFIRVYKYKYETGVVTHTDILLVEPFMRYYTPIGLFGEGAIGFGFYKFGEAASSGDDQVKNAWSLGIGYSVFINKYIAFESVLSYDVIKEY